MLSAYDIETFIEDSYFIPYCIVFIIKNKKFFYYYSPDSNLIIDSLFGLFSNVKKKEIIFIHNLNFDGLLILEELTKSNIFKFEIFIKKMNIYYINIFFDDKEISFRCSYKILPVSLKSISKSFNLNEKMIFPYAFSKKEHLNYVGDTPDEKYFNSLNDYRIFRESYKNNVFDFKEYSLAYCLRDVEITGEFMFIIKNLIEKLNINFQKIYSAPSLSLKIFINKFNNKSISFKNSKLEDDFIRPAYYGGRCEVYGNPYPREQIFHFDFSGMYGQCMLEKFSFGSWEIKQNASLAEAGFHWIEYESNSNYPILPHHRLGDKKLIFCNGILKGCFWFEEINLFIKYGGIVKSVINSIVYSKFDYVFQEFVEYFNKIRTLGNDYKTFAKLIINSLYGRMGMSDSETFTVFKKIEELSTIEATGVNIKSLKYLNSYVLLEIEIDKISSKEFKISKSVTKKNIAMAAAITAKARIKLYEAQQSVLENGGRLLYSDTDSIFAAYTKNVSNEKHGSVVWENNEVTIKDVVFINPKSYAILYSNGESLVKIKGYNQKNVNFFDIKNLFYSNNSLKLLNFRSVEKKNLNLSERISKKEFYLNNYDKRKFTNMKKDTVPLHFENFDYS